MLPLSNSATQGDGIPVSGPLLEDLQACITGTKHPPLEQGHAAGTWRLKGTAVYDDTVSADLVKMVDATAIAEQSLGYIPVGTRITTVAFNWHSSAGSFTNFVMSLKRRLLTSSAAPGVVATATVGGGTVGDRQSIQTYNHTLETGYAYWLEVGSGAPPGAPDVFLIGATVERDRL